jgi:hypothetical protein
MRQFQAAVKRGDQDMAKVWLAYRGPEPTKESDSLAEIPLEECVSRLGLQQDNWRTPLEQTPKFEPDAKMADFLGPRYVVVEIGLDEAKKQQWRAGFYVLEITPADAKQRLSA